MATFIVSTVYKKGLFGCSISTIDEKIENPESINEYAMKAKLLYEAKSKISKNIYTDSILRNIDTVGSITDTVDRFSVEFGVLAAIKFLDEIVDYGDTIIISGTPYVRELVRGALEIVEAFEADLAEQESVLQALEAELSDIEKAHQEAVALSLIRVVCAIGLIL